MNIVAIWSAVFVALIVFAYYSDLFCMRKYMYQLYM